MRRLAFAILSLSAVIGLGCGPTDTIDQVHDLRILAMRAEPPEVILGTSTAPVTLTGLIADPPAIGSSIDYVFSTCAQVDQTTSRCLSTSDGYQSLLESDYTLTAAGGEVAVQFFPSVALLTQLQQDDPYHGFGGLWLPVQLEISTPTASVFAVKLVVFTIPGNAPPQPANTNPGIAGLTLDGQDWADGTVMPLNPETTGDFLPAPLGTPEHYTRQTFDGKTLNFTESWRYDFFTTLGKFGSASTGGTNNFTGQSGSVDSTWNPLVTPRTLRKKATGALPSEQDVTFWIVVQDGRGGENWITRQGHWSP